MVEAWAALGVVFDGIVVHERLQASRTGLSLLLLNSDDPVAFAKLREGESGPIEREYRALEAMSAFGPTTFTVPEPLGMGSIDGWHYLVTSAFAPELHTMPRSPRLEEIVGEIGEGLRSLECSADTHSDWKPMHGDFTPWNLRQRSDGTLFLVDWEDAGWAPDGADEVLYRVAAAQLAKRPTPTDLYPVEAREFWISRLRQRNSSAPSDRDAGFREGILRLLGG